MDDTRARARLRAAFGEAKDYRRDLASLEAAAGVSPYYLSCIASGRTNPSMSEFLRLTQAVGVDDLGEWFRRRAFPRVDVTKLLADLPHPSPPYVVQCVRRTARTIVSEAQVTTYEPGEYSELAQLAEIEGPVHQLQAVTKSPHRDDGHYVAALITWLDDYRYEWPARAAKLARAAALELCPSIPGSLELFVRAVAVYASSLRMRGSITLAAMVLREVLPLAYRVSTQLEAELTQRASYMFRVHARHHESLAALSEAGALYASVDDRLGQARAILDRGVSLHMYGDLDAAVRELDHAVKWLPESEQRHCSAAHLALGLVLCGLGDEVAGRAEIAHAEQICREPSAYEQGVLSSIHAGLARVDGDDARAEVLYRENLERAERFSPFDGVLTALDLLALLVDQGRHQEAASAAQHLYAHLHPLRHHPTVQQTLRDVVEHSKRIQRTTIVRAQTAVRRARRAGTPHAAVAL